ncbi:MAG: hypothetical protein U0L88_00360 [Acutalibacteraceae bacterium]|nr:hypothetical protein [Acutalibacteraceae bacterium]
MSNNLITERDERTKRRKKFKQKVDKIYNLSYKDEEKMMLSADGVMKLSDSKIRLLDEGAVVGDDFVSFIIKKGTLEKYLNGDNEVLPNIDPNEKYTVNLGHQDFATFPFIIGEFKKEDLSLVDLEDDRKGLDVALHLDEDSVFVQELKRQPYDIGVSAEFQYHVDLDTTFEIGILVIDEVYIFAYGLVGECGNVNSSGLELKGDAMENIKDTITEETLDEEKLGAEEAEIPATTETKPTAEETSVVEEAEDNEPAEDEAEDEAEEAEEESEKSEEDEAEETAEDGDEDDVDEAEDTDEEELSIVNELREQIQTLTNTVAELTEANAKLKKTNRKLSAKYQSELDKKEKFKNELKGLSVELLPDEDKKEDKEELKVAKRSRNGIGEI